MTIISSNSNRPYQALTAVKEEANLNTLCHAFGDKYTDPMEGFFKAWMKALGTEFYIDASDFTPGYIDHISKMVNTLQPLEGFETIPDGGAIPFRSDNGIITVTNNEISFEGNAQAADLFKMALLASRDEDMIKKGVTLDGWSLYEKAILELSINHINQLRGGKNITVNNKLSMSEAKDPEYQRATDDFNAYIKNLSHAPEQGAEAEPPPSITTIEEPANTGNDDFIPPPLPEEKPKIKDSQTVNEKLTSNDDTLNTLQEQQQELIQWGKLLEEQEIYLDTRKKELDERETALEEEYSARFAELKEWELLQNRPENKVQEETTEQQQVAEDNNEADWGDVLNSEEALFTQEEPDSKINLLTKEEIKAINNELESALNEDSLTEVIEQEEPLTVAPDESNLEDDLEQSRIILEKAKNEEGDNTEGLFNLSEFYFEEEPQVRPEANSDIPKIDDATITAMDETNETFLGGSWNEKDEQGNVPNKDFTSQNSVQSSNKGERKNVIA